MNNNDKEFLVQKIRTQYVEKKSTQLDELKKLDSKAKRPVTVFAYIFGSIGAVVMGCGMSLVMTDIADTIGMQNSMPAGIAIGVIGMIMATVNYPIYKYMLKSRKKKYAEQILKLSDEIMDK